MNFRWTSGWYLMGRKALSRSTRGWWSGVIEAVIASVLILLGVILLVATITSNILQTAPTGFYWQLLFYVLQPLIATTMIAIGTWLVVNALWQVGASAERRSAIVSKTSQLELLNEIHRRRGDLPTVPARSNGPHKGVRLPFRIVASRRSIWGLATAGLVCLMFVIITATLVVTAYVKWKMGRTDWVVGGMLAIPIFVAAIWSFYSFLRQLLKTTSVGATLLELAKYPAIPGNPNRMFISQSGRLRLKSLYVVLVCMEEATFDQGTNTLTERKKVYEQRLFRKRGVVLKPNEPFEELIDFSVPTGAMHSFQSSSNRITWQIEVHNQIAGLPQIVRIFELTVIPNDRDGRGEAHRHRLQSV